MRRIEAFFLLPAGQRLEAADRSAFDRIDGVLAAITIDQTDAKRISRRSVDTMSIASVPGRYLLGPTDNLRAR